MKIRNSNLTFRLIQFFFEGYRPKDLCSFWWLGIAAWAVAFISPPTLAVVWTVQWFVPKSHRAIYRFPNDAPAFLIILGGILFFMISAAAVVGFLGEEASKDPVRVLSLTYIVAPIGISILAAVMVLLIRFAGLVFDGIAAVVIALSKLTVERTFEPKPKRESILMARFRDWKDKSCTRIDYID